MGLAASQARFLCLTGRKTNVEYEGQQVNQARTALANQSANYYNQLLTINVPTPPSTTDFTKVVYTFEEGQMSNQITFMVAKENGDYMVSYKSSWINDFAIKKDTANIVVGIENDNAQAGYEKFMLGGDTLRNVGDTEGFVFNADGSVKEYTGNDNYLKSQSAHELEGILQEEKEFSDELDKKYGENTWMVRYVENTSSGTYEAQFYSRDDLNKEYYNKFGGSESSIDYYYVGAEKESAEIKGVAARFGKDASGRYTSITIHADDPILATTYALKTDITTDQVAYENAMNQYYYNKNEYDQAIQQINAKIKLVQEEDRSLELKLRQLDTEQAAITQEFEAVQKVLEKNTENSFNLFG